MKKTLYANKGATLRLSLRYLDSDRTPVDLTGANPELQLTKLVSNEEIATYPLSYDNNGLIFVNIDDSITKTWPYESGYVIRIHQGEDVIWLLNGRLVCGDPA